MPRIVLKEDAVKSRGVEVRKLMIQLSVDGGGPAWTVVGAGEGGLVIATFDGTRPSGSSLRDWRFLTRVDGIRANYHEVWKRIPGTSIDFYLSGAYLTIYQRENIRTEKELLALHCDPDEPDGDWAIYKRGPHLHIESAAYPIPKAHIAIALASGHLDDVLADVQNLTEAFNLSIKMICDEILRRLE